MEDNKAQARRFAAYQVYCHEQREHIWCSRVLYPRQLSVRCISLSISPFLGTTIVQAMHEAMLEHQHPLPYEFERAGLEWNPHCM